MVYRMSKSIGLHRCPLIVAEVMVVGAMGIVAVAVTIAVVVLAVVLIGVTGEVDYHYQYHHQQWWILHQQQ